MDENAAAGPAHRAGLARLGWYQGGVYVITDELGIPVYPEWYPDEFGRLLQITLHDSRHTTLTLMEHAGVPISIVSMWAGHYDAAATQTTYVQVRPEDLRRGTAAPARLFGAPMAHEDHARRAVLAALGIAARAEVKVRSFASRPPTRSMNCSGHHESVFGSSDDQCKIRTGWVTWARSEGLEPPTF